MRRFVLSVWLCVIMGMVAPMVMAQEMTRLDPPLSGAMYRMEVFQQPIPVTEVLLGSRDKGLTYLSEYKGKIVLLNIWATWCPPCVSEMPSLNALQAAYSPNDLAVIPVSLEKDMDVVKKFMVDNKLTSLTPYIDSNGDTQKLEALRGVAGVPVTLIFNRDMQVIARYQGDADWSGTEARAVIDYFIKNAKASPSKGPPGYEQLKALYR
jgi:thiol-disulfide isomerase/thioredoxin